MTTLPSGPSEGSALKHVNWWLMLIGPVAVLAAMPLTHYEAFFWRLQNDLETPAPYIVGVRLSQYT